MDSTICLLYCSIHLDIIFIYNIQMHTSNRFEQLYVLLVK